MAIAAAGNSFLPQAWITQNMAVQIVSPFCTHKSFVLVNNGLFLTGCWYYQQSSFVENNNE
jgi:hypothetical protein